MATTTLSFSDRRSVRGAVMASSLFFRTLSNFAQARQCAGLLDGAVEELFRVMTRDQPATDGTQGRALGAAKVGHIRAARGKDAALGHIERRGHLAADRLPRALDAAERGRRHQQGLRIGMQRLLKDRLLVAMLDGRAE